MPTPTRPFFATLLACLTALLIPLLGAMAVLYRGASGDTPDNAYRGAGWLLTVGLPMAAVALAVLYAAVAAALGRWYVFGLRRHMALCGAIAGSSVFLMAELPAAWAGQAVTATSHLSVLMVALATGWFVAMCAWVGGLAGGFGRPAGAAPTGPAGRGPTVFETLFVLVFGFGVFIGAALLVAASDLAEAVAFTDSRLLATAALEFFIAVCTLMYLRRRHYPMADFLPAPTLRGSVTGLWLALAAWAVSFAFKLPFGQAMLDAQPIAQIVQGSAVSAAPLLLFAVMNGWFEEAFLLGFFTRQFAKWGLVVAVGGSLLIRITFHIYQGWIGAVEIGLLGLVFTLYYWRTRRLWPVVFAHVLLDAVGLSQIG